MSTQPIRIRRRTWYLLPIFFHIIGGVIAYFAIRNDDPQKAKRCLFLGVTLFAINIAIGLVITSSLSSPDNFFGQMSKQSEIDIIIQNDEIQILLNDQAKFLAVKWDPIVIPRDKIVRIHDQLPKQSSSDLTIPGTYIPKIVKAGTYITEDGSKEFWFTKNNENNIITIELKNHEYDRIVLESKKTI